VRRHHRAGIALAALAVLALGTPHAQPSFRVPFSFDVGSDPGPSPASVAVADFNGDGIPDLAVANYGQASGTVSVLLGNGDGTFQAAQSYPTGASFAGVAVADFSGDGIPDSERPSLTPSDPMPVRNRPWR
jgi:hypothetical protein